MVRSASLYFIIADRRQGDGAFPLSTLTGVTTIHQGKSQRGGTEWTLQIHLHTFLKSKKYNKLIFSSPDKTINTCPKRASNLQQNQHTSHPHGFPNLPTFNTSKIKLTFLLHHLINLAKCDLPLSSTSTLSSAAKVLDSHIQINFLLRQPLYHAPTPSPHSDPTNSDLPVVPTSSSLFIYDLPSFSELSSTHRIFSTQFHEPKLLHDRSFINFRFRSV